MAAIAEGAEQIACAAADLAQQAARAASVVAEETEKAVRAMAEMLKAEEEAQTAAKDRSSHSICVIVTREKRGSYLVYLS